MPERWKQKTPKVNHLALRRRWETMNEGKKR